MIDTIENNAYLLSCKCPNCMKELKRRYGESEQYCPSCGVKLHIPSFTREEIDKATLDREMDEYEDL